MKSLVSEDQALSRPPSKRVNRNSSNPVEAEEEGQSEQTVSKGKKEEPSVDFLKVLLPESPQMPKDRPILITHWNINGLAAKLKNPQKQFQKYMQSAKFDILAFNETKLTSATMASLKVGPLPLFSEFNQFHHFSTSRKGYAGVCILSRFAPIDVINKIGHDLFDSEGRVLALEFEEFFVVAVYVPYSGAQGERLDIRVKEWDGVFLKFMNKLKEKKRVIVLGDLNVAHTEDDVKCPMRVRNFPSFTAIERSNFSEMLCEGWVDVWRTRNPTKKQFTWFDTYGTGRPFGDGWRIDYVIADYKMNRLIERIRIRDDVQGSDHVPIEVIFKPFAPQIEPEPEIQSHTINLDNPTQKINETQKEETLVEKEDHQAELLTQPTINSTQEQINP